MNELIDDPWELDLSAKAARKGTIYDQRGQMVGKFNIDAPFTPADLETILRIGDIDNWALAHRMEDLIGLDVNNPQGSVDLSNRVTTESWDIPCPNIIPTPEIRKALINAYQSAGLGLPNLSNLSFTDLVRGKMLAAAQAAGYTITLAQANSFTQAILGSNLGLTDNTALLQAGIPIIAAELVTGLSRPICCWGCGWISTAPSAMGWTTTTTASSMNRRNSWRRRPFSASASNNAEPLWKFSTGTTVTQQFGSDLNWDGFLSNLDQYGRQEFAKHLYTLMMLLTDCSYAASWPISETYYAPGTTSGNGVPYPTNFGTTTPSAHEILHAYRVASGP